MIKAFRDASVSERYGMVYGSTMLFRDGSESQKSYPKLNPDFFQRGALIWILYSYPSPVSILIIIKTADSCLNILSMKLVYVAFHA